MPAARPILGYPSRTDAAVGLRAQGLTTAEIARRMGISPSTVSSIEHRARKRLRGQADTQNRTVLFHREALDALRPFAAARDITPNELARRLVEAIVDDGLITAVLDDGK